MQKHVIHIIISLLILLLGTNISQVYAQLPLLPEGMNMSKRVPVNTLPASSLDFTKNQDNTGNVSLPIPLVSLGGVDVQLKNYNKDIANQVRTENQYAPSGTVGIGWQMLYGSISGEINGSADTSDDRYFYNGSDGSFELIEGADGVFRIPSYKPWKIQRMMNGVTIGGWIITKEDGTILRFGNYNSTSGFQSLSVPPYATRFNLGYNGLVSNPASSLYNSLQLIPYQWDLSNIQDIAGNQTTLNYTQVMLPLKTSSVISNLSYTRESHLSQILDNRGNEILFNYAAMNTNEYYNDFPGWTQNLVDTLSLSSIQIKRNSQIYKKIDFTYNSQTIAGITKRYLSGFTFKDKDGNPLPSYKFSYYTSISDIVPGAIKTITSPDGGIVTYTYKTQTLGNVKLDMNNPVYAIDYYRSGRVNDDGLAGKNFIAVRSWDKTLKVYRQGTNGWQQDMAFSTFTNVWYSKVANDFIVYSDTTGTKHLFVMKQKQEGWKKYDIDSLLRYNNYTIGTEGTYVVGIGLNYFVIKHNMQGDINQNASWDVSIVMFTPTGLLVQKIPGTRFCDGGGVYCGGGTKVNTSMRAFCGENYMVLASKNTSDDNTIFSHFKYYSNGIWNTVKIGDPCTNNWGFDLEQAAPHRIYIGKNFVVAAYNWASSCGGTIFTEIKVFRKDGSTDLGLTVVDDTLLNLAGGNIIVGDDYYAYTYTTQLYEQPNDMLKIKIWNTSTNRFETQVNTNFQGLFSRPFPDLTSINLTGMGNRLILNCKCDFDDTIYVGYISYVPKDRQWLLPAKIIHLHNVSYYYPLSSAIVALNQNTFIKVCSDPHTKTGGYMNLCLIHAYQFQGDVVTCTKIDSIWTSHYNSTGWIWQPGSNFLALARSGLTEPPSSIDSINLYTLNNLSNGTMQFQGTPTTVVVNQKTYASGMGDNATHNFTFDTSSGVMNQYFTPEYGSVKDSLPGNNGKTISLYYTSKDSIVPGLNYKDLAGMVYNEREYNNQSAVVNETQNTWKAIGVDSINGVFEIQKKSDTTFTDNVPKVTSYYYGDYDHAFLLSQITETNSDGTQRITNMKYPLDYATTSPSSSDQMVSALDSMKNVSHIINAVVEKWVIQNDGKVVAADLVKYKGFGPNQILPQQSLVLRATAPITDFTESNSTTSTFTFDNSRYLPKQTFDLYNTYGQIMQQTDANGVPITVKWGYNYSEPIAYIANAKDCETSIADFEDGTFGEWIETNGGSTGSISTFAHTGNYGWYLSYNSYKQIGKIFTSVLNNSRKYTFSGWVKTSYPFARLVCKINYNNGGSNATLQLAVASGTGNWQYLSGTVDLHTYPNIAYVLVTAENGISSQYDNCYWDDLRFGPSDALIKTATYDTTTLQMTSISGQDGNVINYYGYDGLGRLTSVKDGQGNLQKYNSYYYSRDVVGHNDIFCPTDPNYVRESSFRSSTDSTVAKKYSDGHGRTVENEISEGGGNDIISYTTYDSLDRVSKAYKPFEYVKNDNYFPDLYGDVSNTASGYYNSSVYNGTYDYSPFSLTEYYDSKRPKNVKPPGDVYQSGNYIQYFYGSNDVSEVDNYPANTLNKTTMVDENGIAKINYKDVFGNTVQSVIDPSGKNFRTTFTFDLMGNLKNTKPPRGYTENTDLLNTTYQYNTLQQLTQKTSPDAGTVQYLYDLNGNLRFTQDAKQAPNKFTYRKYDALNRVIEIGEYTGGSSFTQAMADYSLFPELTDGNRTISQVLTYDDLGISDQRNLNGRLAGSISYRQGVAFDTTHYSYDNFGRVEWVMHRCALTSDKKIQYWYDLQGNVIEKGFIDLANAGNNLYTFYKYNPAGRLWKAYTGQNPAGSDTVKEAEYTYFAAGQVKRLQLANAQGMDYRYNERDWLKQINHQNLGGIYQGQPQDPGRDGFDSGLPVDVFGEVIGYNNPSDIGDAQNATAQFNGNISWLMYNISGVNFSGPQGSSSLVGWTFGYDQANRLDTANFGYFANNAWQPTAAYDLPSISFDANGNITTMTRLSQTGGGLDNMLYRIHSGTNRIDSIWNQIGGVKQTFQYDANGNVTADSYRGLSGMYYNVQNLPEQITKSNGNSVKYWYDTNGNRIRKQEVTSGGTILNDELYMLGMDSQTEAVYDNQSGNLKFWNILAGGQVIGRIEKP
ncbi:MAG: hypothetical protein ABR936_13785 [Bacteroidota bacterium]